MQVTLAYVMQNTPYMFSLIGRRKDKYLVSNIEVLNITLSTEQIVYIESMLHVDLGFLENFVVCWLDYLH